MSLLQHWLQFFLLIHSFILFFHPPPSFAQNVNANPRPTPQDLAGFWDLLQLSIEDISFKFDELYHLKSNDWQPVPSAAAQSSPERKVLPTPAAQCPGWGRKAAETGLSPPTTTTAISPSPFVLFFLTSPFNFPPVPAWDRQRASCPAQRGQRDPFTHAWKASSQRGLPQCVFLHGKPCFEHACVTSVRVLQWSMAKMHALMRANTGLLFALSLF